MLRAARIALVLLIIGMYLFIPINASASTSKLIVITASPFFGNGTCVYDFAVVVISDYEIQLDWIPGNGTGTYIVGAYGRWPADATDGFVVYSGTADHASHWLNVDIRILSDLGLYYKAYNDLGNGTYAACFASGSVTGGGEGVHTIGLALMLMFPIALMILGYMWSKLYLLIAAGIAWMGIAVYAFAAGDGTWDIYRVVGALAIAMILACLLITKDRSNDQEKERQKLTVKIEPAKSYGERYTDWENKAGVPKKEKKVKW